jgi:hypothetical protein
MRKTIYALIGGAATAAALSLGVLPASAAPVHAGPGITHGSRARAPKLRFAAASAKPVAASHTVTTQIALDPDSGDAGNYWGYDTYTQVVTITRSGGKRGYEYADGKWQPYPVADCGGGIHCYHYTYTMSDDGYTQTIAGQDSPGNPAFSGGTSIPLDVVERVTFSGGTNDGSFFSSYKNYYTKDVPVSMDENGVPATGNYTTGNWVLLGQPGAHTASLTLGADAGWLYTAPEGTDAQCPRYSGLWIDAQASNWGLDFHGNILAPDAADCASQLG